MSQAFSDGALLKFGWAKAKEKLGFFIVLALISIVVCGVFLALWAYFGNLESPLVYVFVVLYYLVIFLLTIGWMKIVLGLTDGSEVAIADLFKHWNVFLKYVAVSIVYAIVVYVGLFLFIIPGVIWSIKFMWAPWLVVDKGMGPIEAMKESSRMTMGMKWDLFAFYITMQIAVMLGMIPFGLGLFVTIPMGMLATAKLYREQAGKAPAPKPSPAPAAATA